MATIESQDLSIAKLFNDFYIVPSYQREYVWTTENIDEFFDDILNEFEVWIEQNIKPQYFIGSIIVCETAEGLYELIDGQQRITTTYLLLCSLRDFLKESATDISKLNDQISATDIDEEGNNIFRYRVTLQYEDSCGIVEQIASQKEIAEVPNTSSAVNLNKAYTRLLKLIRDTFTKEDISKTKKFYAHLTSNVVLVRVKTETRTDALRIFATINNRGVSLDAIDLVKNLMFIETNKRDFNKLKSQWKKMLDILYTAKEKPMRFMRYFILANYDRTDSLKGDIYSWLLKNTQHYADKPLDFVDKLVKTARYYSYLTKGKDLNNQYNSHIANIRVMSNSARMPFIILLSGKNLPNDLFNELCKQVENIFFVYLLTREPTRNFERRFPQWCSEIRRIRDRASFETFIKNKINPEKRRLSDQFETTVANLNETEKVVSKTLIRYLLAKLTQYVNNAAYGEDNINSDLKPYISKKIEIEHILPQTITPQVLAEFDHPNTIKDYVGRLGNLTLLEKTINTSIQNQPFSEKKKAYPKSQYILTRTISEEIEVGKNTTINQIVSHLQTFPSWTSESIEKRQKMLTELAKKVWEMPE